MTIWSGIYVGALAQKEDSSNTETLDEHLCHVTVLDGGTYDEATRTMRLWADDRPAPDARILPRGGRGKPAVTIERCEFESDEALNATRKEDEVRTFFIMGLLGAALAAPLPGQDYSRIDRWAGEYCGAAKDFMDSLIELEKQQKQWELSYALIQHFQNTISAAERSAQRLERIELPRGPEGVWEKLRSNLPAWADYYAEVNRVREVHQATIRAMSGIREAAQESIRDINYASNRGLFQNALQKYQESARKQAEKLESATKELSPKSRASLGRCTLNLIPGPQR